MHNHDGHTDYIVQGWFTLCKHTEFNDLYPHNHNLNVLTEVNIVIRWYYLLHQRNSLLKLNWLYQTHLFGLIFHTIAAINW